MEETRVSRDNTGRVWETINLSHARAGNQTWAAAVTSERHTSALSRPHLCVIQKKVIEKGQSKPPGGFKSLLQLANFTLGRDATLDTEIHKNSVRLKAPNSVNASKRKHKNQINHYNKQRRVLMANSTVCQSK